MSWMLRTWSVTDSTLAMWRNAQNVRITYARLLSSSSSGALQMDDLVEYEELNGKGRIKSVHGIDTASTATDKKGDETKDETAPTAWNWRGKGWLFFVSSHWEVIAWGDVGSDAENEVKERFVVTWFAPTLFTKEGIDFYSDRREGLSDETRQTLLQAFAQFKGGPADAIAQMVERDMKPVKIKLPWKEG